MAVQLENTLLMLSYVMLMFLLMKRKFVIIVPNAMVHLVEGNMKTVCF